MNQSLKALVIENHSQVSDTVKVFADRGLEIGLFESVEYNLNSLHETPETMLAAIAHNDCIIVQSEWLYKDQLEMFLEHFANHETRRLTFFIWNLEEAARKWAMHHDTKDFQNLDRALENLRTIIGKHTVYTMKDQSAWYLVLAKRGLMSVLITENALLGKGLY